MSEQRLNLTLEDVLRVAAHAALPLTPDEAEGLAAQLNIALPELRGVQLRRYAGLAPASVFHVPAEPL